MDRVKVCFRIGKDGEPIVVFPYFKEARGFLTCYAHVGQHSVAAWDYVRYCTRPATPEEYTGLLAEIKRIGYNDLEIMQRLPSFVRITKNQI